jgi:hypothetical protein
MSPLPAPRTSAGWPPTYLFVTANETVRLLAASAIATRVVCAVPLRSLHSSRP